MIPVEWEERVALFGAYLIQKGKQSDTLQSYISAIKHELKQDNILLSDDKLMLSTLIKACRLFNDVIVVRMPIGLSLVQVRIDDMTILVTSFLRQDKFSYVTFIAAIWSRVIMVY